MFANHRVREGELPLEVQLKGRNTYTATVAAQHADTLDLTEVKYFKQVVAESATIKTPKACKGKDLTGRRIEFVAEKVGKGFTGIRSIAIKERES